MTWLAGLASGLGLGKAMTWLVGGWAGWLMTDDLDR